MGLSFTKRAFALAVAMFGLAGCDFQYELKNPELLRGLLTPTPTPQEGQFPDPTATPTQTPTRTPTPTNTVPPAATGLRIEFNPPLVAEGTELVVPTNNVYLLGIGRCYRIAVVAVDGNGSPIAVTSDTSLAITSAPAINSLYNDASCSQALGQKRILNGTKRAFLYTKALTPTVSTANHTLTATATSGMALGSRSEQVRFVRDYYKLQTQLLEPLNGTEIPGGLCRKMRVSSLAFDGGAYTQLADAQVKMSVPSANISPFSKAGCGSNDAISLTQGAGGPSFLLTIAANTSSTDFWVKTTAATGTATFSASSQVVTTAFYAVQLGGLSLTIVRAIVELRWNVTSLSVVAGVCSGVAAHASASAHNMVAAELRGYSLDNVQMEPPANAPIVGTLTVTGGLTAYTAAACATAATTVTVSNGNPGRVWVKADSVGSGTVSVASAGLLGDSFTVNAGNGPTKSRFKTPFPSVAVTECSVPLEIELVNTAGTVTLANVAGGGDVQLVIDGLTPGSQLFAENDIACTGTALASVRVAANASSGKFRLRAGLTDPPTNTLNLSVTTGLLPTASAASLALARKDLETDLACLNEAGTRAGYNTFRMVNLHDEVATTVARFPSGKLLIGGISTREAGEATATPFGAMALVGEDCRLDKNFFASATGYTLLKNSQLYPGITDTGSGIHKVLLIDEVPNANTGATRFYALGFAIKNGQRDLFVARYRSDGTLDPTYGEETPVVPEPGQEPIRRGYFTYDFSIGAEITDDEAMDAALVDGRLIVVANSKPRGGLARIVLAQFTAPGVPTSGGIATIQFQDTHVTYGGLAIYTDQGNKFALVGATLATVNAQGEQQFADWYVSKNRITPEGGWSGQPSSPAITLALQAAGDDDRLAGIALQSVDINGTPRVGLVLGGHTYQGVEGAGQREAAFARLKLPGLELDLNQGSQNPLEFFQNPGKQVVEALRHQFVSAMGVDLKARVLGVGREEDANQVSKPYIVRLTSNGAETPVSTKISNTFDFQGTRDAFYGMLRRPDNKMIAVGSQGLPFRRQFLISRILE